MTGATRVTEGTTSLRVPAPGHGKGPKRRQGGVFYNPAMRLARDMSVLVAAVEAQGREDFTMLDGLAATGARGVRVATEVPGARVLLNEVDERSLPTLRANASAAGEAVEVRHGTFETAVTGRRFHYVDVDPFGSPARLLDAGVRSTRGGGVLGVAATDTAALCGVYAKACRRRYDARPMRGNLQKEVGLRILMGALARAAARHDRAVEPLVCHSTDHYFRAYVRIVPGPRRADACLDRLGVAWMTPEGERGTGGQAPGEARTAGPLWTGPFLDAAFLQKAAVEAEARAMPRDTRLLLARLADEAEAPDLFYLTFEAGQRAGGTTPRIDHVLQSLQEQGLGGTRTHFHPQAVKTRASFDAFCEAAKAHA